MCAADTSFRDATGRLRGFGRDDQGVTAIEYALLAGLLATAVLVGATALGVSLSNLYDYVVAQVAAATGS